LKTPFALLFWLGSGTALPVQDPQPPPAPLTLVSAIAIASTSYGEVQASEREMLAAGEGVTLAKRAYLPAADLYAQWNRATRNNVFGLLLPGGLPSISGPVLEDETSQGTFGSVAAALLRWEAIDFGVKAAGVREADAVRRRASAGLQLTGLDVSLGTVDSFLGVVAGDSAATAAAAAVERMEVFTESVSALVENELRPGADLSLARAELSRARNELVRAEAVREQARVSLAEWLGRASERIEVDGSRLIELLPSTEAGTGGAAPIHPLVEAGDAEREQARARRDIAGSLYRPKIDVLAAVYTRGSGALLDGSFEGGSKGLWPETTNWAVGLAVRFPLLDFALRQETELEEYLEQAAEARYANAVERVAADRERARIHLDSARRVAENTPVELEAARALQTQARARYDAGLADVLEVAEAERILRRAETENAIARLDVWRARFEVAAAEGNLTPVLSELE
jgi:outer membrane protein TolC